MAINVSNKLHAATGEEILADAHEVWEEALGKRQSEINQDTNGELYGCIVFDNTSTGEQYIVATRFADGDITQGNTTYRCFVTISGALYYVDTDTIEVGTFVSSRFYSPEEEVASFMQCGVVLSFKTALRGNTSGGGSGEPFDPNGTYPNLTAGNMLAKESDAVRDERISFIFRSAAGDQSISDGKAKLTEIFGNLVNGVPFTADKFRSIFYNAFNPENVIEGYALDSTGALVATEGHTIAIVHVLACDTGSGENNGYRVKAKKDTTCTINRVGYSASYPTTSTTATVLTATTLSDTRTTYVPSTAGYLLVDVSTTEVANLLVALAWSYDPADKDEDYHESVIDLPAAHDWGSAKAGTVYDEISWLSQIITKRVERALMTDMTWEEIVTEHTVQEEVEGVMTDVTVNVYTYKSSSLASSIKASTTNLVHYGLANDVTVDENGNVIVAAGNSPLTPESAFAGIYLYYELAEAVVTPMTDESTYDVGDFGTEEFLNTTIEPTYATFLYLPNMIDQMRAIILNANQANIREEKLLFENTASSIYASDVNCTVKEVVYFNCSGLKFNGNSVAADFVIQANTLYNVAITASADNAIVIIKTEQIN